MGGEGRPKFEKEINDLISQGWQPIGGVAISTGEPQKSTDPKLIAAGYDMYTKIFCWQAMAK